MHGFTGNEAAAKKMRQLSGERHHRQAGCLCKEVSGIQQVGSLGQYLKQKKINDVMP